MLNRYFDRIEKLVSDYQKHELPQFCGPTHESARWDDLIWYYIDPNTGRKTRFLCGKHGARGKGNAGNRPEFALRYPYDQLIKVWIIVINNVPASVTEKQARVSAARYLISNMRGELYSQTRESIAPLFEGTKSERVNPFLAFCAENGVMRSVQLSSRDLRDRTGHALFDSKTEKLPDIEVVLALGKIYRKIFQMVGKSGAVNAEARVDVVDAAVITFGLLGLASPTRLSAEAPLLTKQRLKKYSEDGGKSVHYLEWPGSKGFKDNRNHVLAVLAHEVDRAINFFFRACEPARILCRFYENPKQQSLRMLLGDFKVASDRLKHLQLDEIPNLFVLGYALGFYGATDCVPVVQKGLQLPAVAHNNPRFLSCFTLKPIHALNHEDMLSTSGGAKVKIASIPRLLGYISLTAHPRTALGCASKSAITIRELQDNWIRHVRTTLIPEFPSSYSSGEGKIRLADALFCVQGSLLYRSRCAGSGGKPLSGSLYSIAPLKAIATHAMTRFTSTHPRSNIFEDYGFAGLSARPHSLRHFGNTLAELSEIPCEIITAWSGRKDREQTETYLHMRHQEQANRVRRVMSKPEQDQREIRVLAQESVAQATNLPATVTSVGLCTQELNLNPCEYLNDFVSQCFLCSAACHIAGDSKAIQFFEKDHEVQAARLAQISIDQRLQHSIAMKKWFVIHSRNTYVLSCLIDLMKTLASGTVIRFSQKESEFHITDTTTKAITKNQCLIPNFEITLSGLISGQSAVEGCSTNPALRALLSSFGLSDEDSQYGGS